MQTIGQEQLALPYVGEEQPDEGFDLWGFVRRRQLMVFFFMAIGLGLGYLYYAREEPEYRSEGIVRLVMKQTEQSISGVGDGAQNNTTFIMDDRHAIASPMILNRLVRPQPDETDHKFKELPSFQGMGPDEILGEIARNLKVAQIEPGSHVLTVSYQGKNPDDTQKVTNAVLDSYVLYIADRDKDVRQELKILMQNFTQKRKEELDELIQKRNDFLTTSGFVAGASGSVDWAQLSRYDQKRTDLTLRAIEVNTFLTHLEEASRRPGGTREALVLLIERNGTTREKNTAVPNEPIDDTDNQIRRSQLERRLPLELELSELTDKYGSEHPQVRLVRDKIARIDQHFKELAGLVNRPVAAPDLPASPDFLTVYMQSLRDELSTISGELEDIKQLAQEEEAHAQQQQALRRKAEEFDRQIAAAQEDAAAYLKKVQEIDVAGESGGVDPEILRGAGRGVHIYPKLPTFLGMGGFLGMFLGILVGYAVELADKSFRKPEDIIREFGVPIIGHIPFMNHSRLKSISDDAVIDKSVLSVHLPRSRVAEAYRAVRTAIYFSSRGGQYKVIQITSPAAGDGKSTLAINLAVTIAQSGKSVLLLESDFRRPRVHKLLGCNNKVGVTTILNGKADIAEVLQQTPVESLSVMACGPRATNPAELVTGPEYQQLLETLRERFDYVIVDTPPVLAVTDPCGVAARVDGVIVAVRLSNATREIGKRTMDQLRDVGGNIFGVVVNGVEEADGYGYGSYRYSDYRYYYRNYRYGYGEEDIEKGRSDYYSEEDETEATSSAGNLPFS